MSAMADQRIVGPVLTGGLVARAVAAAICELNAHASVDDHGAYLRISAPGSCMVTREAIEAHVGGPFRLPGDLERVMPSFRGKLSLTEDEARWD
jgi:hypothetical protein